MTLIVALVAGFFWIGATAREFDWQTKRRLLALITVAIALDYARGIF